MNIASNLAYILHSLSVKITKAKGATSIEAAPFCIIARYSTF